MEATVPGEIVDPRRSLEKYDRRAGSRRRLACNISGNPHDLKIIEPADQAAFEALCIEVTQIHFKMDCFTVAPLPLLTMECLADQISILEQGHDDALYLVGYAYDEDACFAVQVHLDEAENRTNTVSLLHAKPHNHIRLSALANDQRPRAPAQLF